MDKAENMGGSSDREGECSLVGKVVFLADIIPVFKIIWKLSMIILQYILTELRYMQLREPSQDH